MGGHGLGKRLLKLRGLGQHQLFFPCAHNFAGLAEVDECYLDGTQIYLKRLLQ